MSIARFPSASKTTEHCFDPVVDMLAQAEANWDGMKRLDRLAAEYFNCEDAALNAVCMRKTNSSSAWGLP